MKRHFSLAVAELAANGGSATIKRMWLPRFTLRLAFLIVTLCAFIALVAGQAVAGKEWAIAVIIAIGGAAFFFIIYALIYLLLQALPVASRPTPSQANSRKTFIPTKDESSGAPE